MELMAKFKVAAVDRKHEKLSLQVSYRVTSHIRNATPPRTTTGP